MKNNVQNYGMNVLYNKEKIGRFNYKKYSPEDRIRIRELRQKLRQLWLPAKKREITGWRKRFGINASGEISDFVLFSRQQKEKFFQEAERFIYIIQSGMERALRDTSFLKTVESCCEVIGLPESAEKNEIKKKFRKLVLEYHPDRGGNADEFIKLYTAYTFLMNREME